MTGPTQGSGPIQPTPGGRGRGENRGVDGPGQARDHGRSRRQYRRPGPYRQNVVDLEITADPADVPAITSALLGLELSRQQGRDP